MQSLVTLVRGYSVLFTGVQDMITQRCRSLANIRVLAGLGTTLRDLSEDMINPDWRFKCIAVTVNLISGVFELSYSAIT